MERYNYQKWCYTADSFLQVPDVRVATVANPMFHILSDHPINTSLQRSLIENGRKYGEYDSKGGEHPNGYIRLITNLANRAFCTIRRASKFNIPRGDAIIISVLTSVDHLKVVDDFYFGQMQQLLRDRGAQAVVILINLTGTHYHQLPLDEAYRINPYRFVLPDFGDMVFESLNVVALMAESLRMLMEARRSKDQLKSAMLRNSSKPAAIPVILKNLRLFRQILELCNKIKPRFLITLFEGHAWERLAYKAAKMSSQKVLCVGYQHSVIRKGSHAIKRLFRSNSDFDPDMILTLGDITNRIMQKAFKDTHIPSLIYGTHRNIEDPTSKPIPLKNRDVLVLPEGLPEESVILIRFTLQCAATMPGTNFLLRCHPVFPIDRLNRELQQSLIHQKNISISDNADIMEDYNKCGYLLYRGSSTAIYAVLHGLRPLYVDNGDGVDIDPLYTIPKWRKQVTSVKDVRAVMEAENDQSSAQILEEWYAAANYCRLYVKPVQTAALDAMLKVAYT